MTQKLTILFDLDGTLLDSFPDFLASLENINIKSSSKKIDESIVRANVSDGSSKLLKLVFDIDKDDEDFDEVYEFIMDEQDPEECYKWEYSQIKGGYETEFHADEDCITPRGEPL